jgi:acetylornithine deacetylase
MLPSRYLCVLAEVLLVSALSASNSTAPSYRQDLLDLHRELVEIPSNSGLEEAAGKYLHNYLSDKGWAVTDIPVDPRSNTPENATRSNILAGAKGSDTLGAKVLLNTHFDTVPPHICYSIEEGGRYSDQRSR